MRFPYQSCILGLCAGLLVACGSSGSSGGTSAPATTAGQGTEDIVFGGITSANALNPNEVVVSWPAAVLRPNLTGAQTMRYRVYRSTDRQQVLTDAALVHETQPGVTSYVDRGLPGFTTFYYRVVAVDTDERLSLSQKLASARTPSEYGPGVVDFDQDILPLWSTPSPTDPNTDCLSCHTTPGPGRLDLSTIEGILIGTGTAQNPDSFVIAYDGEATWAEFLGRMTTGPTLRPHLPWIADPNGSLAAMEDPLKAWAAEGALEEPDSEPPLFAFGEITNVGNYFGRFLDFDTVEVTFPHAEDPESLPFNGSRAGQLEYAIYAGKDSVSIDWATPVALAVADEQQAQQTTITATFDWTQSNSLVVVVRPLDASGRSVDIDPLTYDPETATAAEMAAIRDRMRNQSANEREIIVRRE